MKLRITHVAQSDLRQIERYSIQHWGPQVGFAYSDRLRLVLGQLVRAEISSQGADYVSPGLRKQVAASHVIWFRIQGDNLLVVRVLHQSRDVGPVVG
ncbi:type II toxin-antitoxin system RelE/ParE family toxin [Pseudorhodobacter ferrugineus]|uniref:type II toxin-antitoxin system RelE/ParE family toxin n=1 Tax=Pseudorhodobacter ferrugineus TaxID=77008 RepID=UPI0003B54C3E|nr:type II toxin-antitoxin system RelE/ParE family toxin [Pseudorhodobacter ferrugineus]